MLHKLKPVPRFILIAAVVGGVAYALTSIPAVSNMLKPKAGTPMSSTTTAPIFASSSDSLTRIVETGVAHISVQSPAPPFFNSMNGVATGFNVDFLNLLFAQPDFAKNKRISIEHNAVDTYADVPKQLSNDKIDLAIDGLTFPDNEPAGVVYSAPYIEDFGYSLVGTKALLLRSPEDINDLTIGILSGDPDVKAYVSRQFPRARLVELSDATASGQRTWMNDFLKAGRVDGIVYDYPFAVAEIAGTDLQFAATKLPGSNIKYRIGVRKSDVALLEAINASIRKIKSDPAYADLIRKYFTSSNTVVVKAATKSDVIYAVKPGDTLSSIAQALLGDRMRFAEIETRNNLANPNLIHVGQKLVIPKV